MAKIPKIINFLIRLFLGLLIIGLSLKQIQETNNFIKAGQDTVTKSTNFFHKLNFYDLNRIYKLVPPLISTMNYTLLISGVLLIINIMDNIFLDQSSKCYLMASAYVGIYGVFLWIRN